MKIAVTRFPPLIPAVSLTASPALATGILLDLPDPAISETGAQVAPSPSDATTRPPVQPQD